MDLSDTTGHAALSARRIHIGLSCRRGRRTSPLAGFRLLREITITRSSYGGPRGVTYAEDHVARTIGICRVPAGSEIVVAGECGRRRHTMEVEGTRWRFPYRTDYPSRVARRD